MEVEKLMAVGKILSRKGVRRKRMGRHHWTASWRRPPNGSADMREGIQSWATRLTVCQQIDNVSKGSLEAMACETLIL